MRDPERLENFYKTLKDYHKEYFPDWRFGQLIINFGDWLKRRHGFSDMFYLEEDKLLKYFKEYVEEND